MKKVFGQTVRDLKREVNKKVLKVPGIEQKVLDATNNEAWGPHGTILADIAVASINYHEYQIIMGIIWKRINDTGKNWRRVFKALIVLEYLVENGSERVIDEVREHAHQISTLADFQYVDSNGRDQGNNVRRKSQSLVMLLNDKQQIMEVRQKAAANRDKFRNTKLGSGMYRPGGYGDKYDDDRYSSRDEYGYGRGGEGGYRDDDRNSRDGDRHSRDSEERYERNSYREDDCRDNRNGSSSTSVDRDRDHSLDDDGQSSSHRLNRKFSDQSINAPPSYEEAVGESRSPEQIERDRETSSAPVPKPSSPTMSSDVSPTVNVPGPYPPPVKQEFEGFDEFDPRFSDTASTTMSCNAEVDLLGSLFDSFPSNSLSTMSANSTGLEADSVATNIGFGARDVVQQSFDNPFGDAPFKALPSIDKHALAQPSVDTSAPSFPPSTNQFDLHQQAESVPDFGFGDSFTALAYPPSNSSQFPSHDFSNPEEEIDILAGILPPSRPSPVPAVQTPFSAPSEQHLQLATTNADFGSHSVPTIANLRVSPHTNVQFSHGDFHHVSRYPASPFSASSNQSDSAAYGDFRSQTGPNTSGTPQMSLPTQTGTDLHHYSAYFQHQTGPTASSFSTENAQLALSNDNIYGDFGSKVGSTAPMTSQVSFESQAGMNKQFSEGSFQDQIGPSPSLYFDQSQNGHSMKLNNSDSSSRAGSTAPVTSQMSPLASSGMNMSLTHGNFQHEAGHLASPFSSHQSQSGQAIQLGGDFGSHVAPATTVTSQISPQAQAGMSMPFNNFQNKAGLSVSTPYSALHTQNGQSMQPKNDVAFSQFDSTPFTNGNFLPPRGSSVGSFSHNMTPQSSNGSTGQLNGNYLPQQQIYGPPTAQHAPSEKRDTHGNMFPQSGQQQFHMNSQSLVSSSVGPLAIVPQQQSKKKFQTKSAVWADTLSRGLVDLNISGPKTNPLSDIGVDLDLINRKEKRMEKQPTTLVASTITMGKAMGSGSGMGQAGAFSMRPPPNPMVGNMGMGGMGVIGGHGPGMGMGMCGVALGGSHGPSMGMGGMGMGDGHGLGTGVGGMGGGYGGINQ